MVIINNFPVGDSELKPMYDDTDIFPALVKNMSSGGYTILYEDRIICDRISQSSEPLIDNISIYPLTTFYIKIPLRGNSSTPSDQRLFTLEPGHVYRLYKRYFEPAEYYTQSGEIYVYKDENELLHDYYPVNMELCYWSRTSFE